MSTSFVKYRKVENPKKEIMALTELENIEKYWMPRRSKIMYGDMTPIALLGMIGFQAEKGVTKQGLVVEEGGRVKLVTLRSLTVEYTDVQDDDRSIYNSVEPEKK
jgi:hypothetical protein